MSDTEKFTLSGSQVVEKVKQLLHEGNIRKLRILYKGGVVMEMPLTVGAGAAAVTTIMAPWLAALGAFAALVTDVTIEVERTKPES